MSLLTSRRYVLVAASLLLPALASAADEPPVLRLLVSTAPAGAEVTALLSPSHEAWPDLAGSPIHLNRTPPLYADGPADDGHRPKASARLLRLGDGSAIIRVDWTDSTKDVGAAAKRYPDSGEDRVYPQHSIDVESFSDAVCIMVPKRRGAHGTYPSLMMGDAAEAVELYYWRAGVGFQVLDAHGRSSTQARGDKAQGKARRTSGGWTVIMRVPDLQQQTPVCFAIWDGAKEQRDGLKYFSFWYEVQ